ncbi:hypothetical protein EYF80_029670 [Liparis tanakae]|uniref:Uncharacterized protein n=1 Tax=Liparis tanakae TaxID=230148 RepID=A0A4Z2H2M6_9TELE|nr:hypothetical protein EYF80_029670 [Liparis tanakae]
MQRFIQAEVLRCTELWKASVTARPSQIVFRLQRSTNSFAPLSDDQATTLTPKGDGYLADWRARPQMMEEGQ